LVKAYALAITGAASPKAREAEYYAMLFGYAEAVEQALKAPHRTYTAAERAEIWQLTYEERQRLGCGVLDGLAPMAKLSIGIL
jgi:hypothetical protein